MSAQADHANEAGAPHQPERRCAVRQRVLKRAVLSFNRGFSTFECLVRNMSDSGARLSLAETFSLPGALTFSMDGAEAREAVVRWRTETAVGISFVRP
ncbi:MAG: PilZ domain-containing protein [Rhizobiales bacterium]|nr:PilZ domain-containing protein [Hyphomicrobiales bacterium]